MRYLTLTWDDGARISSIKTADIFEKHGLKAELNVMASQSLGDPSGWCGDFALWNELQGRGHVIQPHGYNHTNKTEVPFEAAQDLIRRCLDIFTENLVGFNPKQSIFNFPYNASTPEIEAWLPTVVRAFRTGPGSGFNPMPRPETVKLISWGTSPAEDGLERGLEELLAMPEGWLIYNLHGLDGEGYAPSGVNTWTNSWAAWSKSKISQSFPHSKYWIQRSDPNYERDEIAMEDGFVNTYGVELLYETMPSIQKSDLLDTLHGNWTTGIPINKHPEYDVFLLTCLDYQIRMGDSYDHPKIVVLFSPKGIEPVTAEHALQQTWDWPEARAAVVRCRSTVLVTDYMSRGLEYKARLAMVQQAVQAVMEFAPCLGLHWVPTQRFVSPEAYLRSKQPATNDLLFPAINVRLFNITTGRPGEKLMDTVGLAALGIPDLQCHFVGLDVDAMVRVLYNSAYYLFDQGDVIQDRQTIQGINARDRWRCQHEESLVAPKRVVLDLDPGKPNAAGNRR